MKLLVLLGAAAAHDFKSCMTSTDHAHISVLTLTPDPPVHGKELKVQVTATPDIAVTAGKIKIDITAFGVPVPGCPTFDLCKDAGITCPPVVGKPVNATVSYSLSSLIPEGLKPDIKIHIEDVTGNDLGCIAFDITVGSEESMFKTLEDGMSSMNPFRKLVESPSALSQLIAASASTPPEVGRRMLDAAYREQPDWAGLFEAWKVQHKTLYDNAVTEGRHFRSFMINLKRMQSSAIADRHADKSADELRTIAHFA
jgi:hypothetical protein